MISKCPYCNYKLTKHTHLTEDIKPKPGDYGFCINCGEVNQFTKTGVKKVDIDSLDETCKQEMIRITDAWIKMKTQESLK